MSDKFSRLLNATVDNVLDEAYPGRHDIEPEPPAPNDGPAVFVTSAQTTEAGRAVAKLLDDCLPDHPLPHIFSATLRTALNEAARLGANAALDAAVLAVEDTEIVENTGNTYYAQLGDAGATRKACAEAVRALKVTG